MGNTGTTGGFHESANNPMGNHGRQLKARVGVAVWRAAVLMAPWDNAPMRHVKWKCLGRLSQ